MKRLLPLLPLLLCPLLSRAQEPEYPLTEDSKPHAGVPKGDILKFNFDTSKIFPGTTREVSVYVPKQYDGKTPACVYINQDGVQWNAPVVFDNLIQKGELPVLIGVFVKPGIVKPLDEKTALPRFNRSFEYDGLGPDYARFLVEEILPAVETQTAPDGRKILLSKSGNDRAIGGSSSGAICAFTAAWERPEAFSRVFNSICTMVGLRGANEYLTLIRKVEPKPIRIFLQDGSNDLNIYAGDWWMANQALERSLSFAGYEHAHVWGEGGHNGKQGSAVFPNAMRFLWKGWPEPVKNAPGGNKVLTDITLPNQGWEPIALPKPSAHSLAVTSSGEVTFRYEGKTHRINLNGTISQTDLPEVAAFGKDDAPLSLSSSAPEIARAFPNKTGPVASRLPAACILPLSNGNIYIVEVQTSPESECTVWLVRPDGSKQVVEKDTRHWHAIAASTDQSLLYLSDRDSHWVYSFQIQSDGTLLHKQRYHWLHTPDTANNPATAQMCVDTAGRLYVATNMGIQICDQPGRVNAILTPPGTSVEAVAFGGDRLETLYAISQGQIYKRKLKSQGAPSNHHPLKPEAPKL